MEAVPSAVDSRHRPRRVTAVPAEFKFGLFLPLPAATRTRSKMRIPRVVSSASQCLYYSFFSRDFAPNWSPNSPRNCRTTTSRLPSLLDLLQGCFLPVRADSQRPADGYQKDDPSQKEVMSHCHCAFRKSKYLQGQAMFVIRPPHTSLSNY